MAVVSFATYYHALALDRHRSIPQYVHNVWTFQSGLPADVINDVLQTRDGYIWLGTSAGLFRFDGVTFTEVATNPDDKNTHEPINRLYQTHDGSLWIGTPSGGLRILKDGKIFKYDSKTGFFNTGINGFLETRAGHFLVATNIGIFLYQERKFELITLDDNFIRSIDEDSDGRIWAATVNGVQIFDDNGKTKPAITMLRDGLPYPSVITVFADREGNMWVGTYGGLARIKDGKITTYTQRDVLTSDRILTIFEDHDGNIWVGTEKGINRFADDKWSNFTSAEGLTDNEVLSFEEDHENNLWVGTAAGLEQFEDPNIITYTMADGLGDNHVSSMVETQDSTIYFFSDQSTIMTQMKDGKFTAYPNLNIPGGHAYAARDGSIWIGQTGELLNFKNGKLKVYDSKNGIPQRWVSAFVEDDESIIFNATPEGLFRFFNGHATPYLLKNGKRYAQDTYVTCFLRQSDGTIWVGKGDGLSRIQDGVVRDFSSEDGTPLNWVTSFYDDGEGDLWISSTPSGLILFKGDKFTVFNTKIGLFSNEIYCVLEDDHGNIWLDSGEGIGCVKRQELEEFAAGKIHMIHCTVFGPADGVKANTPFNRGAPSGLKAFDGRIWFATEKGAMVVDPERFMKNKLSPPVIIENVIVDQRSEPVDSFCVLNPGTDKIEFHYAALSFKVPQRVMFKYELLGYDHDWVDAGTRRIAYYTNLPPGKYAFKVIACNNDGVWNEAGASFSFVLEPHFHQTYWFYLLILLSAGGTIFGIYRLRVWQLLKREKELNARIQEAMAHIKTLGGLIPICSNCKKIRDDEGYWEILEKYIQTHADVQFSHGICPDCYAKLYPDFPTDKK